MELDLEPVRTRSPVDLQRVEEVVDPVDRE